MKPLNKINVSGKRIFLKYSQKGDPFSAKNIPLFLQTISSYIVGRLN
jgi:hypothetical protein